MISSKIFAFCLICIAICGCHKKESTAGSAKATATTFLLHHSDSIYRNVSFTPTHDTIYASGTYADTTLTMTTFGSSSIIFNTDTLSLDSTVGAVSYFHYTSPVLVFDPYSSSFTKDTVAGQMNYVRRMHIAASATQIEHLWR